MQLLKEVAMCISATSDSYVTKTAVQTHGAMARCLRSGSGV